MLKVFILISGGFLWGGLISNFLIILIICVIMIYLPRCYRFITFIIGIFIDNLTFGLVILTFIISLLIIVAGCEIISNQLHGRLFLGFI